MNVTRPRSESSFLPPDDRGSVILVFVKAPVAGAVKTRMGPDLSPDQSAELYRAMVEDLLCRIDGTGDFDLELFYDPPESGAAVAVWLGEDRGYHPQGDGDLGARMARAFAWAFERGWTRAVIVGSDVPELDANVARAAIRALEDNDLVLAPSHDGGYSLIGLRREIPELFVGIPWSTDRVYRRTMEIATGRNLSVGALPALHDVDTFADLERLSVEGRADFATSSPRTAALLRRLLPGPDPEVAGRPGRRLGRSDGIRIAALILLAAAIVAAFRWSRVSPSSLAPANIRSMILSLGPWGPALFILIYALRAIILIIPVGVLSLAGGLAYGPLWGAVALLAGANLGSCLAFLLARYLGRGFLERFGLLKKGKIRAMDEMSEKAGFRLILFVRLIPLFQYDVVNFGAGLSRMRFRDYALGTLIGMAPAGLIVAQLGSSLTNLASVRFAVSLGLFVLLILAPVLYKAWRRRRGPAGEVVGTEAQPAASWDETRG